ncbi:MAG TPA: 2-oxo acid dehydrogenase subunit E2 [Candidatus Ozemobacteraceae bacterium]
MSHELQPLGPDRLLVWDLLRETDPYYLNHHLFDTDFTAVEADRDRRRAAGRPVPSYVAYALAAYGRTLAAHPRLNGYLRLWPRTRLSVFDGVDIALTIERFHDHQRIVLLALLRNAAHLSLDEIVGFLHSRRDQPLESLEEWKAYQRLQRIPAFCRWHLFQLFVKPFPDLLRRLVGTTAFTSVGKFGTTATTPLSPRSCTLSLGCVEHRPRVVAGIVRPALSSWLTVTYDHRIADGADIARFGTALRSRLETWNGEDGTPS